MDRGTEAASQLVSNIFLYLGPALLECIAVCIIFFTHFNSIALGSLVLASVVVYIGLTVAIGQAFLRSVKVRFQKHISRAKCENRQWAFCKFIRSNSDVTFKYEVIEVVRGRKPAYQRERELIVKYAPTLNTF